MRYLPFSLKQRKGVTPEYEGKLLARVTDILLF